MKMLKKAVVSSLLLVTSLATLAKANVLEGKYRLRFVAC